MGIFGAEANYFKALIQYEMGNLKEAEKQLDVFFARKPAYKYWTAKGYLLISDILIQKGEAEEAKLTLNSLLNGYKSENPDDILVVAEEKLEMLLVKENNLKNKKSTQEKELELNVENKKQ